MPTSKEIRRIVHLERPVTPSRLWLTNVTLDIAKRRIEETCLTIEEGLPYIVGLRWQDYAHSGISLVVDAYESGTVWVDPLKLWDETYDWGAVVEIKLTPWSNDSFQVKFYCLDPSMRDWCNAVRLEIAQPLGPLDPLAPARNYDSSNEKGQPKMPLGRGPGGKMLKSIPAQDQMVEDWFKVKRLGGTTREEFLEQYPGVGLDTFEHYITEYNKRHKKEQNKKV
jgi:hypothetical protein